MDSQARTATVWIGLLAAVCAALAASATKLPLGEWTVVAQVVFAAASTYLAGWIAQSKPADKAELKRLHSVPPSSGPRPPPVPPSAFTEPPTNPEGRKAP